MWEPYFNIIIKKYIILTHSTGTVVLFIFVSLKPVSYDLVSIHHMDGILLIYVRVPVGTPVHGVYCSCIHAYTHDIHTGNCNY